MKTKMSTLTLRVAFFSKLVLLVCSHPKFSTEMEGRQAYYLGEPFPFKTKWPLLHGLVGISLSNLNTYILQFPACLVHVYNYQGIEITGITEPIVLSRFDVFGTFVMEYRKPSKFLNRLPIEKVPPLAQLQNSTKKHEEMYVIDKSTRARWYCQVKFDLFFPEIQDAVHFHLFGFPFNTRQAMESLNFGPHVGNIVHKYCK